MVLHQHWPQIHFGYNNGSHSWGQDTVGHETSSKGPQMISTSQMESKNDNSWHMTHAE